MRWLSVDPGDTTGWQLWDDHEPVEGGQTPNWEFVRQVATGLRVRQLNEEIFAGAYEPLGLFAGVELIVCEDFVIYPEWLAGKALEWDSVETARVIGALFLLTQLADIEFVLQGANIKESAVAGGAEDLFTRPVYENRHENDAIMHGVYYIQTKLLTPATATVKDGRLVARGDG